METKPASPAVLAVGPYGCETCGAGVTEPHKEGCPEPVMDQMGKKKSADSGGVELDAGPGQVPCPGCGQPVDDVGQWGCTPHWFKDGFHCPPLPVDLGKVIPKVQSVYESLQKLYKLAPEGSYAKLCLQLACRSVQMASRKGSW